MALRLLQQRPLDLFLLILIAEVMLDHTMRNLKPMVPDTSLLLVYQIIQLNVELLWQIQMLDVRIIGLLLGLFHNLTVFRLWKTENDNMNLSH